MLWALTSFNPPLPILQLRKVTLREVKKLAQNYSACVRTVTPQLIVSPVFAESTEEIEVQCFSPPSGISMFSQIYLYIL